MRRDSPPARLSVVDALRAFALLGIIINHIAFEYIASLVPETYSILFSLADRIASKATEILTFGKFFTIFSFLFGLSFAIQLNRATEGGRRHFSLRFLWRLMILLAMGVIHGLFYSGDILAIYAVLGIGLLACRRLSSRTLVIAGLALALNIPIQVFRTITHVRPTTAQAIEEEKKWMAGMYDTAARDLGIKRSGTLREVVAVNTSSGLEMRLLFQLITGRVFITAGLFLLGMVAGRPLLFVDSSENRRFFRRLLIASSALTLITTPLAWMLNPTLVGDVRRLPEFIGMVMFDIHQIALSAGYLASFTLLFWTRPSRALQSLVAAGQMGLTVYLTQSLFGVSLFYGFGLGLMGKIGLATDVLIGIAFFALQVWLAGLWMRRYHFGPVEWLWRSLTWLRLQPLRRVASPSAAARASA